MEFFRSCIVSGVVLLIAACGSTTKEQQPQVKQIAPQTTVQVVASPMDVLERARNSNNPTQYYVELVKLTAEQDCTRALKISDLVIAEVQTKVEQDRLHMIVANCHLQQANIVAAKEVIELVPNSPEFLIPKNNVVYEVARANGDWWQAANAWYLISEQNRDTDIQLWEMLQQLATDTLKSQRSSISPLSPLVDLLLIQRQITENPKVAYKALENWQQKHRQHSFSEQWPESIAQIMMNNHQHNDIAVLLPLSGQRKQQGMAIKEGILSASFAAPNPDRKLTFIDTNLWSTALPENLDGFDLIIGPLLKQNIELIAPLVPETTKVLSLNRVDLPQEDKRWYYYSLAPEDEAIQLSNYLHEQGFTKPMLVVSQGNAYQRMKDAFVSSWSELTTNTPVVLSFSDNKNLRKEVNEKFALTSSKSRVRKIRSLLKAELHAFERNRRDVDAIVVFANATQTELINPLIEASISPFADIVPVYSTSRSHSKFLSANGLRDLRNLYVIDMPWMLNTPKYAWQQQKNDSLWPDRRDIQNRLFALGYDAFNIANALDILHQLPNQIWRGMTGELKLDDKRQIKRTSVLAQFMEQEVQTVESD